MPEPRPAAARSAPATSPASAPRATPDTRATRATRHSGSVLRLLAGFALALPLLAACDRTTSMELDPDAAVDGQIRAPSSVEAPPSHAERSPSGLAWVVLEPGDGQRSPVPTDMVRVHYTGWQTSGEMFDSSVVGGEPAVFPAGGLIAGWVEGLQLMTEGEERRFWIPAELAYGDPASRPGAPAGMLVFDVKLIEVLDPTGADDFLLPEDEPGEIPDETPDA
ncbi:hypothetical protein BH23GEM11_BH23GEM11_04270 [soil metagenome]